MVVLLCTSQPRPCLINCFLRMIRNLAASILHRRCSCMLSSRKLSCLALLASSGPRLAATPQPRRGRFLPLLPLLPCSRRLPQLTDADVA
ncbi:conserved hypothetical protein [Ricinus communis]|uniref:Uncharacterized protein n=1 Tax=Ricinus communis TaxID=3988 RepID=B9SX31_RICCO|nr:conserved hypothetical protein [Ricinus communis]